MTPQKTGSDDGLLKAIDFLESFNVTVTKSYYKDTYLSLLEPHSLMLRLGNTSDKSWIFADLNSRRLETIDILKTKLSRQPEDDAGVKTAITEIINVASILATRSYTVSECQSDWDVKVPKSVLAQISKQNDRMGSLALRLKKASDVVRANLLNLQKDEG